MYQPKTGVACSCKRGIQRDNCPNCEGTGWQIDFKLIRQAIAAGYSERAKAFWGSELPERPFPKY